MRNAAYRILVGAAPGLLAAALVLHPVGAARAAGAGGPGTVASARSTASVTGDALLALAAWEVATVQETHYTHHTVIDHGGGIYDTDCSGFVDDLLQQVAPDALAAVPVEPGFAGPRAYLFERFFATLLQSGDQPRWSGVAALADAQPGDILAWSLEPFDPGSDTGHIVVIAATPQANGDGSYSVPVVDASSLRHDDDSRLPGSSGIGTGTITVRIDAAGTPTAFRFDVHDHFHSAPIAIGRLSDPSQ